MFSIFYSMLLVMALALVLIIEVVDCKPLRRGKCFMLFFWSVITLGNYMIVFEGLNKYF